MWSDSVRALQILANLRYDDCDDIGDFITKAKDAVHLAKAPYWEHDRELGTIRDSMLINLILGNLGPSWGIQRSIILKRLAEQSHPVYFWEEFEDDLRAGAKMLNLVKETPSKRLEDKWAIRAPEDWQNSNPLSSTSGEGARMLERD